MKLDSCVFNLLSLSSSSSLFSEKSLARGLIHYLGILVTWYCVDAKVLKWFERRFVLMKSWSLCYNVKSWSCVTINTCKSVNRCDGRSEVHEKMNGYYIERFNVLLVFVLLFHCHRWTGYSSERLSRVSQYVWLKYFMMSWWISFTEYSFCCELWAIFCEMTLLSTFVTKAMLVVSSKSMYWFLM